MKELVDEKLSNIRNTQDTLCQTNLGKPYCHLLRWH